jgi:predicted HicB family RNase H-like nuclease
MPKTKAPTEEKKVTIRIPAALHEQLVNLAQRDTRSLNSEIVVFLQEAVTARQSK